MTRYLTLSDVIEIHDIQIEAYGGASGLRDPGQLESALYRPQTGYYADLIEQAASLWESLSQNHPFVDGNKRTAFGATHTFLLFNNYGLECTADEAMIFVMGLYESHSFRFELIEPWLRERVVPFTL